MFYRPNQQLLRQTLAGGVELQPRPVGTVSGGEGQARTGLVSSHRSRESFQHSATYKIEVDNVPKRSLDDVCRRYINCGYVGGRSS